MLWEKKRKIFRVGKLRTFDEVFFFSQKETSISSSIHNIEEILLEKVRITTKYP